MTRAGHRGLGTRIAAGLALGTILAVGGAGVAMAATECELTADALAAAALRDGSGASDAVRAAAADGLTMDEVSAAGMTVVCADGAVAFVPASSPSPSASPSASPVPTSSPVNAEQSAAPVSSAAPTAASSAQAAAPRTTRATPAPSPSATPAPSPSPTASPAAEVTSAVAPPSTAPRAFDDTQLETFAASGASPQDQRVAATALEGSILASLRHDLPGVGVEVLTAVSAAVALALGGAAAIIGRAGDRRPRHSR